jgi:hypothetical protein
MGAPSKRAKKIRKANEFDVAKLLAELSPPKVNDSVYAWNLEDIFAAREHQMLGRFKVPCRLAESMKTDDAISVAYENRLDPQRCIGVELVPAKGARAAPVAAEAEALFGQLGVGVTPDTMVDIHSALVDHGLAVGACVVTPREDGSRIDYAMKAWPMEFVRWDSTDRVLKTMTSSGVEVPIVHGDGRWVVFRKRELYPWKHGALLPAAIVWARHAFAARDWTKGSVAHGNAKVIGEMPVGMARRGFLEVTTGTHSTCPALFMAKGSVIVSVPLVPVTRIASISSPNWSSASDSSAPRRYDCRNSMKLSSPCLFTVTSLE